MTTNQIKDVLRRFDESKQELEASLSPHLESWVKLKVECGELGKSDAFNQNFRYEEHDDTHVYFEGEAWDDRWQYGGHEHYPARSIQIPFDFIEDSADYIAAVEAERREAALKIKQVQKQKNQTQLATRKKRIEAELVTINELIINE